MHGGDAFHLRQRHGLHQTSAREAGHAHGAGRAWTDQDDVGVKQAMHRDAGVKEPVAESQLHEHQDSSETDACKSNSQTHRLTHEHQGGQWNASFPEEAPDHLEPNRAITFRPDSLDTRWVDRASRRTTTSMMRASASPVGSVDNTWR